MQELLFNNSTLLTWLKSNWLLTLFFIAIASAFVFLRSQPSDVADGAELSSLLTDGRPTVIEFYSNF
ncbi:MAG TPA: hypothetical protein PKE64_16670 [Anaerolineae bacterium]|nr:hypothetical protein [Anaerolineae bacterium]HMR65644.1 hypothetical protein [Anaerolineae bacterium]